MVIESGIADLQCIAYLVDLCLYEITLKAQFAKAQFALSLSRKLLTCPKDSVL